MIDRVTAALEGRYRIERELGAGGMATVYLADDLKHDRKVALKVLKPELAAVVGGERFLTEIKTTANLQHPHILPLFDSGQDDGLLWYAMPWIEGESLRDRLDREGQLPVGEAVAIAAKISGALQVAHDRGIVHRDIKPANILLMNGEPLVADFGIALAVQEAGGGRLTETGLSMGTPFYMSPEQATADRTPDARADVYSLGCVLYEMLAGEPPFTGSSAQAILGRILTQPARPVTEERGSVPPNVASAIDRALQKLPADRFESAAEFARALRDPNAVHPGFATGGHAAAGPGGGVASGLPGWLPWGIAGVATVAAVVFGLAVNGMPDPTADRPVPVRFTLQERTDPGFYRDRFLRITPDGRTIVFRRRTVDGSMYFKRDLASAEAVPIEGTELAMDAAISPDGRFLAFNDDVSETQRVLRVSIDGGSPSTVLEVPNEPIGISWLDNDALLFGMLAFDSEYPGLTRTSISSPGLEYVTRGPEADPSGGFGMHHEPEVLPGGTHALFLDFPEDAGLRLGVVEIATGETRPVSLGGVAIRGTESIVGVSGDRLLFIDNSSRLMAIRWDPERFETIGDPVYVEGAPEGILDAVMSPDGTLVMTVIGQGSRPVIVNDRGQVVRELWDANLTDFNPRLSPDGNRIAVGLDGMPGGDGLWIYDLRTSELRPAGADGVSPAWSADSRTVYVEARAETDDFRERTGLILSVPAAGGGRPEEVARITAPSQIAAIGGVTDDGRFLISQDRGENPDLRRHDLTVATPGVPETEVVADAVAPEIAPRLSPDGRWLAYTSLESGRPQVYVRPWPNEGDRLLVWPDQAGMPVWDPSSDRLYLRTFDGIAAVDFVERDGMLEVASQVTLFTGEIDGRVGDWVASYDVHPDGFILSLYTDERAGRIYVWKDWIHELDAQLGLTR